MWHANGRLNHGTTSICSHKNELQSYCVSTVTWSSFVVSYCIHIFCIPSVKFTTFNRPTPDPLTFVQRIMFHTYTTAYFRPQVNVWAGTSRSGSVRQLVSVLLYKHYLICIVCYLTRLLIKHSTSSTVVFTTRQLLPPAKLLGGHLSR